MTGSMLANVSAMAASSNLPLNRIEPDGDNQVRVWVEKVDFNVAAAWLAKLSDQGVSLRETQIERQSDNGIAGRFVLAR